VIQSGDCTLSTSGLAENLTINSGANLALTGAASLTVAGNLNDQGALAIDASGDGGGAVKIGGSLTNTGAMTIGTSLSASTIVTASGLANSGSITVQGTPGGTVWATLDITGAAPPTATGTTRIGGDGLLEFGSGVIQTIGLGASFELDGIRTQAPALSGLSSNLGTLILRGDISNGPGGAGMTTTTGLTNSGTLYVDAYSGDGASRLTIGGTLTNTGTVDIGNGSLDIFNQYGYRFNTWVTASGLVSSGSITVQGYSSAVNPALAVLDISGAAPSTLTGSVSLIGDAMLEFGSGGITSIGHGASFTLTGAQARASIGGGGSNSALSGLNSNAGTIDLEGWSTLGYGGGPCGDDDRLEQ
jgi:hypothetical protein